MSELRSTELDPSEILNIPRYSDYQEIDPWVTRKLDSYAQSMAAIRQKRFAILQKRNINIPDATEAQATGRLLLYECLESVSDGASEVLSKGFFDEDDTPPWDTWFFYANRVIFCWVPESLTHYAQAGIDTNIVDCIHWADWSALNRL